MTRLVPAPLGRNSFPLCPLAPCAFPDWAKILLHVAEELNVTVTMKLKKGILVALGFIQSSSHPSCRDKYYRLCGNDLEIEVDAATGEGKLTIADSRNQCSPLCAVPLRFQNTGQVNFFLQSLAVAPIEFLYLNT